MNLPPVRHRLRLLTALLAASVVGCLQIDLRISLHEDGTATITERLQFSERLLDLSKENPERNLPSLLTKEAFLARMKQMDKGASFVSHETRDAGAGAKESVGVFKVEDLNQFKYVSPFLAYTDYPANHIVKCYYEPLYRGRNYGGSAGDIAIAFRPLAPPKSEPTPAKDAPPPTGPSPVDVQRFREVRYIFQDMLKDFQLRLTFESYCPIRHTGFGFRGYKARVNYVDMINFTDKDLDRYGTNFLDNEEIMLDLVRLKLGSKNIADTVYEAVNNPSVPVFQPWGSVHRRWIQSDEIYIQPSLTLFKKYFEGKTIDFAHWGEGGQKRPASFDEIGYKGGKKETP